MWARPPSGGDGRTAAKPEANPLDAPRRPWAAVWTVPGAPLQPPPWPPARQPAASVGACPICASLCLAINPLGFGV